MRYWLGWCMALLAVLATGQARADLRGLDYPHNFDTEGIGCSSCHYFIGGTLPSWATEPPDPENLDDTIQNNLCLSCHNSLRAPMMTTHSSRSTGDRYVAAGTAGWTLECRVCHWAHHQKQVRTYGIDTYLATGASSSVTATTLSKTNAGWTPDAFKDNLLIPDVGNVSYQYKIVGNTATTITVSAPMVSYGTQTGKTFAVVRGKLIRDKIKTPNSGDRTVRFFRTTGANSYADGNATFDGVCEVCHTKTSHYRNDGSGPDQGHANAFGTDGKNCLTCHKHANGFAHVAGGTGGITNCADLACHGGTGSHAGHLYDAGLACEQCHNTANLPTFKDGGSDKDNTTVCADCHHDGTMKATGNKVAVAPPDWFAGQTLTCGGCHGNGPDYDSSSPKANSHPAHAALGCDQCHQATTSNGTTLTGPANHLNNVYNLAASGVVDGLPVAFTYSFNTGGSTCANISCHGGTAATWGATACLTCHAQALGGRAAVGPQFAANSHHVQGVAVSNSHCYQCHWEAKADGRLNSTYHGGLLHRDSAVNLVIYGNGTRPTDYDADGAGNNDTAITYTSANLGNGLAAQRQEIDKITSHCLGCHSDRNNTTQPFSGDTRTPKNYAWDGNSIDARYSQPTTTAWGKSPSLNTNVTPKDNRTKAYSAHGNATANQGGWDLVESWPNTRNGSYKIRCFDCHNSHGSTVLGTTTSYDAQSATTNSGLLKDTTSGQGGYTVTYRPAAGGNTNDKNVRNPGASLCFDCHLTADGSAASEPKPWGYQTTFGASQAILGYFDTPYMGPGQSGSEQRYPYKALNNEALGGHFGKSKSTALVGPLMGAINGLCTPCHDPHGVSPTEVGTCSNAAYVKKADCQSNGGTWTPAPQYGVPLLKGTWLTSPYKEDVAPAVNEVGTVLDATYPVGWGGVREGVPYHIDQNTFGDNIHSGVASPVAETANQFAGLCLQCHPKNSLTDENNGGAWKSLDRIHEAVKGWGANVRHQYTCAKCHTPHNGSVLPRLMVTNCLNTTHKGRVGYNPSPALSLAGSGDCDCDTCWGSGTIVGFTGQEYWGGGGHFPGNWNRGGEIYNVTCHENRAADQSWNSLTDWTNLAPSIQSGPSAGPGNQKVLMHLDEASWNGTANEIRDSSGGNNHGTAYNGATTAAGGIGGRAGSFNGTNAYALINYAPPMDNFTIEAWIKPTTTHEIDGESASGTGGTFGQRYVFEADYRGTEGGAGLSAGTNGVSVYEHGASYMPALAVYSGTISSSQWTHVAVVYSNRRPSIYLNGVLVRTGVQSLKAHVYAPTRMGGGAYGYFRGLIDEVAVYNGTLSSADILEHYQRGSSVVCNGSATEITWITDFSSTSFVDYGLTASYGLTAGSGSALTSHSVTLSGLAAPATYHYRVRSANGDGEAVSGDYTFETNVCSALPPVLAAPTATAIGVTTATLGANVTGDGGAALTARGTVWGIAANPAGNAGAEGGTATGSFTQARTGLPAGTRIYYRGYATNSAGTGYSADGSFHTEPSVQAAGVSFAAVSATELTVAWSRGSGSGVLVLMRQGSAVTAAPVDGAYSGYTANPAFGFGTQIGAGNYVVYKGPGTGVVVTGLTPGTSYHVAVHEYTGTVDTSGVNQGTNYKALPATGNQATTTPVGASYSFTFNYTGAVQSLTIPAGATDVQFTVKGAGGGGGRRNNYDNQESGQNGRLVLGTSASGATLSIYVGGGGAAAAGSTAGTAGGWGYHAGGSGGAGEDYRDGYVEDWTYGGAGGGGSSAVLTGGTVLIEAGGGAGGRSSDYVGEYYNPVGGAGGAGGGSDYPSSANPTGGGAGGLAGSSPAAGGNGQVVVAYYFVASAPVLTSPTATAIGSTTATLGADITNNGGAPLTARGTVWSTSPDPAGNALAEGGTATGVFTQARSSLTAGNKIYYRGYATNDVGTGYSPGGSFYAEPSAQATGVSFSAVSQTGMTVNWTRGNGAGVLVLMRQGSAVNANPVDGTYTGYAANPALGNGTQIGTGNFVVYKGTGTSVAVTGLTYSTTYYVAIHEYAGAEDSVGADQGTNYKSSPATGSQATSAGGQAYSYTFNYTGSVQTLAIPAGATNIQFSLKGAGGGGGREDGEGTQENGSNGHLVVSSFASPGVTLRIYVGGGGAAGSVTSDGAGGGWGYHAGGSGGAGDDYGDDWAYGGAGGGGSSAILLDSNGSVLAEAAGGSGGRSSDWYGDWDYCNGGEGGVGGGTDNPGTTNPNGGGAGGLAGGAPAPGGNGQVVVSFIL